MVPGGSMVRARSWSATKQHGAGWPGGHPAPATSIHDLAATAGGSAPRRRRSAQPPTDESSPRSGGALVSDVDPRATIVIDVAPWTHSVIRVHHGTKPLVSGPHGVSHWCCGGKASPTQKAGHHPMSGSLLSQHSEGFSAQEQDPALPLAHQLSHPVVLRSTATAAPAVQRAAHP